ncbi:MAG: acyl-CoA/acyl-ACP dehydrogenase [Acidobacteria bacterium]|nr:acyl-CoA/acyl-ACP dehydrogenase [Acidobacteriota bacterium]
MKATLENYLERLEQVCSESIAPHAPDVDRDAVFPSASVAALASAGLLGAASATEVGGLGLGVRGAAKVVERVARDCGSTAMVSCMHFSGVAVVEALGPQSVREAAAAGSHLLTLAFSEAGSRSQFWAPVSSATVDGDFVVLDAKKSWVTSATAAASYVWSSQPCASKGMSTLWLVPSSAEGLKVQGPFDGLGLRGNDSSPVTAQAVRIPASSMLGKDGGGFDAMLGFVLPTFCVCNAACALGLMQAATARAAAHVTATRYQHTGAALADLPTIRAYLARMRVLTDSTQALLSDTLAALETRREDALLRVLESKAHAGETATQVLDLGMRICGGAAFRKDVGIERYFRDARAAGVMGPTTDVLYDFIGKAACGMEVFA